MANFLPIPSFPSFGTYVLLGVMIAASYTFSVSLAAGRTGAPRTLQAARFGAYGTVALIGVAVLCLAYAFVTHDFRLRYVSHYSDRSMGLGYLFTALWGGQDGSLLWWLFLLSLYIGSCIYWLGNRYLELQPYVIATLMSIVVFFCVLMAFSANPFAVSVGGARADGDGLNPLLQNFYMIIHPPSLYTGFVGCSVPFAFAISALVTGRLDHEWIVACRKWTLFAWLFLGIGNTLGMLWAYEELGWGGYWAWDPVENAAFMPFLTASAFVHSVMIQERRGMLKVWNIFLVCFTFFMTIFGTFLTRSGAIASVHSFAQSSIGTYFLWYLAVLLCVSATLVFYRWPELKDLPLRPELRKAAVATGWFFLAALGPGLYSAWTLMGSMALPIRVAVVAVLAAATTYAGLEVVFRRLTRDVNVVSRTPRFESWFSREFTFMINNWALLGFMAFVFVATTFPMVSEALWDEKVSVGPPYYNAWVQPIGLIIFALMGVGTLFGWKKTSPNALRKAFIVPTSAMVLGVLVHVLFGKSLGYPAVVFSDPIYPGGLGQALRVFNAITPCLGMALIVFNAAIIVQEFAMLYRARSRSGAKERTPAILYWLGGVPGLAHMLVTLPAASRRRYGGYVVHLGIVLMFFGFTGKSWTLDKETSLAPGQSVEVANYTLEYQGPRMEVDPSKRMVFADLKVTRKGEAVGKVSPAKFIFKKMPESPTTEVAMLHSMADDLYVVVGSINPETKVASLQIHVNPLVSWIWLGCILLIMGSVVCMWPDLVPSESRVWAYGKAAGAVAASITVGVVLAILPARPAWADGTSSLHSGTVKIESPVERDIFGALRCMCGSCARELLSTCACGWADDARKEIRELLARGMSRNDIVDGYAKTHGTASLAVPPNSGGLQAIYLVPLLMIGGGAMGLFYSVRRWRHSQSGPPVLAGALPVATGGLPDVYDARIDDELRDLDD